MKPTRVLYATIFPGAFLSQLISTLLVAFFLLSINIWAFNFPNSDDYTAIVVPLLTVRETTSTSEIFRAIFLPHTQHYQALSRVIAALSTYFTQQLDFRFLIFLGSLFIIPLLLLIKAARNSKPNFRVLVVAAFMCQPLYAEATQWTTSAISYTWVNVLGLAAFHFGNRDTRSGFLLGIVFSVLAVCTWGNGILVPLLMLLSRAALAVSNFILLLGLFLGGVVLHMANPNIQSVSSGLEVFPYFVRLLGCSFGYLSAGTSLWVGSFFLLAWTTLTLRKFRAEGLRELCSTLFLLELFLLGSSLICAVFRANEGAHTSYSTSRYTLQSALLFALLFIKMYDSIRASRREIESILVVLSLLWTCFSYTAYYSMYPVRSELLFDSKSRWACFTKGLATLGKEDLSAIHHRAEDFGVLKKTTSSDCLGRVAPFHESLATIKKRDEGVSKVEHILWNERIFHVAGYAFRPNDSFWSGNYELILKSSLRRYAAPLEPRIRPDVSAHMRLMNDRLQLSTLNLEKSGFSGFFDLETIDPGTYDVFLGITNADYTTWAPLKYSLTFPNSY